MRHKIRIIPHVLTYLTGRLAVELSHLIGFESVVLDFPILQEKADKKDYLYFILMEQSGDNKQYKIEKTGNKINISFSNINQFPEIWAYCSRHFSELTDRKTNIHATAAKDGYVAASDHAQPIPPFDKRLAKGLESLFEKDFILLDENHDLLPDTLDTQIYFADNLSYSQLSAACNLAARLGMETTAVTYPITISDNNTSKDSLFVIETAVTCSLELAAQEQGCPLIFRLRGDGIELEKFSAAICNNFPLQNQGRRWVDLLEEMAKSLAMQNLDGQLAWLEHLQQKSGESMTTYFSPNVHSLPSNIRDNYPCTTFNGYKDLKEIEQRQYDLPWEIDVCKEILDKSLWPQVKPGDSVKIFAVLSEDKNIRNTLEQELHQIVTAHQAQMEDIQIICAYKQGFSWMEEVILPKLAKLDGLTIDKLEIAFKPFLPPDKTDWVDEDGAMPSYTNVDTSDPNKWYDLPIRYLQELYPIDDIIAPALNIHRDCISFVEYIGDDDITYEVHALAQDKIIFTETYRAYSNEQYYIDLYPGMGKVHPGTGHVIAWINGKEILSERIRTDVEAVWDIFQQEILPWCRDFCDSKTGGQPKIADQPFFAQLHMDIQLSEPDNRIGIREDMISSLDALHEDIYFVGTDFFKVYGANTTGDILDAPGLVLPDIRNRPGKPSMTVTLYDQHDTTPFIKQGNKIIKPDFCESDVQLFISELRWENDNVIPVIQVDGSNSVFEIANAYIQLLEKNWLAFNTHLQNLHGIYFKIGVGDEQYISVQTLSKPPKNLDIRNIDLCEKELIGYKQYLRIIEDLKHVSGIDVYPVAESYLGRIIYAIELLPSYADTGGYVSRTKRLDNPSELIIGRHHANEVSSTNAMFMLLRELLTNPEFNNIANEMNIVMIPFENADGAAIHYELQENNNPWWKLHIARFNALGKEFYYEYFNDDTIHTEAHGFTRLWRRWLPDAVIDNHGVPSHEWEQQFSGYTSPSYKGFWLPRSLLYNIFLTIQGDQYINNIDLAKRLEIDITNAIGADNEIKSWNADWQDRFKKYANTWFPRLFPADYFNDMISYWFDYPFESSHRYPSVRFPWITSVAFIAEVADETAHGDYLHLCARTHLIHNLAIIRALYNSKRVYREEIRQDEDSITSSRVRLRPLVPKS